MERLPKTFRLLGHTIKVKPRPGLHSKEAAYGMWVQHELTIYIDPDMPPSLLAHTFWHEATHAVLDLTGFTQMSENEVLVDSIGGALAQIIETLK